MFSAPEKTIEQLNLKQNHVVADFGTGTGAYALAVAGALGDTGRVYAIEVQKDLLTRLQNTVKEAHLGSISFIWGNCEIFGGTKLRGESVDLVILSNLLFQTPNKKGVLEEANRVLKRGGRILLVDWTSSFNNMGPLPDQVFPELEAHKLLASFHTLTFETGVNAGNFHYGLIFQKGGMPATHVTEKHNAVTGQYPYSSSQSSSRV